ncbi:hypothetical protein ACHAXT_011145 [Thalassiosira profunda]
MKRLESAAFASAGRISRHRRRRQSASMNRNVLVARACPHAASTSLAAAPTAYYADDVLSNEDIAVGAILAVILALGWSFLNGQSSSTSFVSWPSQTKDRQNDGPVFEQEDDRVFDEESWKEMSREENYVLYNTKIRQRKDEEMQKGSAPSAGKKENRLILAALLVLFVPIFSVEFFFALSRQFMCEMGLGGDLVEKLCSPIVR